VEVELDGVLGVVAADGVVFGVLGVLGSGKVTLLFEADGRSSGNVRLLCRILSIAV
jgi:predicted ABC-type transport system involved in lysophospholipase L1 biosynthesis ATPase subunit